MARNQAPEYWSVWYPQAASTGLLLARGMLDPTDTLIVHAAPPVLTVEVTNQAGSRVAYAQNLEQTQDSPMCLLRREGAALQREDIWPTTAHYGLPVLLPGGEVGILNMWWHADDRSEWRWQVEFYNRITT